MYRQALLAIGSFENESKNFREIDGRLERFRVARKARFRDERVGITPPGAG